MMIKPSIDELLTKVDCKYTLVTCVSKRAKQIMDGETILTDVDSNKAVTIAINELNEDKITFVKTKSGIK